MREGIGLYKAKRVDNGKWVEGNLVLSNDAQDDFKAIIIPQTNNGIFTKHTGFKNISCYLGFEEWYKVDESTLCQWTGLVDKNGVKVFEGDIVESVFNKRKYIMCYGDFTYENEYGDIQDVYGWYNEDEDGFSTPFGCPEKWAIVICNIHDEKAVEE